MVEYLPRKQYVVGLSPTRIALFSFSIEKVVFRLVVLLCFDLCRPKSFHVVKQISHTNKSTM